MTVKLEGKKGEIMIGYKLLERLTKNWTRKQTCIAYMICRGLTPLGVVLAIMVLLFKLK